MTDSKSVRLSSSLRRCAKYSDIAQLASASGSYPAGRWFKSNYRYHYADVVEQVDTRDLKSLDLTVVEVRVLSSAPLFCTESLSMIMAKQILGKVRISRLLKDWVLAQIRQ